MSGGMSKLFSFVLALSVLAAGQEPVKPRLTPKIMTATRQVTLFTALEKQLLEAVQKKDKAGLRGMLADEFEIDMPDADPLAGDDWVAVVISADFNLKSFVVRQVTVADLGEAAVVKFDRMQQATFKERDEGGEFFVVDLWKKNGDSWKLSSRYVARVGAIPADMKLQPKPTGKE